MKRPLVALLVIGVVGLAGCAGMGGSAPIGSPIKAEHVDRVKDTKKVFISEFAVAYRVETKKSQSSKSFGLSFEPSAQVKVLANYKLVGVTDAHMQAMTDALYHDAVAKLRAAGYEVVTKDDLKDDPAWKKVVEGGKASGSEWQGARAFAPTGMTIHNAEIMGVGSALSMAFSGASHDGPYNNVARLMNERKMAAFELSVFVDFAQLEGQASSSNTGYVASADAKIIASFVTAIPGEGPSSSKLLPVSVTDSYNNPFGGGKTYSIDIHKGAKFTVKHTIKQEGGFVTEDRDVTSTGMKAAVGLSNAISILGGMRTGRSSSIDTSEHEAVVDPALYEANVKNLIGQYLDEILKSVKTG